MRYLRKSQERGHINHGWLDAHHSFSFGQYQDSRYVRFGPLRVINEDRIEPARGFGRHGHRNMEILTYMLEGQLQHQDSLGHGSIIQPGQIQRMTAGRGIEHAESNPSVTSSAHLLQIWIEPNQTELAPSYQDHDITWSTDDKTLTCIATGDVEQAASMGIAHIHQDINIYAVKHLSADIQQSLGADRLGYLHMITGKIMINDLSLGAGDALGVDQETLLQVHVQEPCSFLWFDMAHGPIIFGEPVQV